MDEEPLDGVCVVAAPKLGKVTKSRDVRPATTTRAHHHIEVRVLGLHTVEHLVETPNIINIQVALILLQVRGIDIRDG